MKSRLPQCQLSDAEQDALLQDEDRIKYDDYSNALINCIVDVCCAVIRRLHEDGVIVQVCGRPVVIVTEMLNDSGDSDYRMKQVEAANPPGLASDYMAWTYVVHRRG